MVCQRLDKKYTEVQYVNLVVGLTSSKFHMTATTKVREHKTVFKRNSHIPDQLLQILLGSQLHSGATWPSHHA